jgi:hypothetical protein
MDKATDTAQAPQTGATYKYGSLAVPDANGTADAATASEGGVSWLDSAALAECRRLTAENAALAERNAELRAALDEQGDELAALRREAASVPTELESGRLLIVADSIASDADGLRTIEAYGRFFEREDGGRDGWMKLPLDMDGVPIREGDTVQFVNDAGGTGAFVEVCAVSEHYAYYDYGKHFYRAANCRHVKPRTLEDVLSDFAARVLNSGHQWGLDAGKATAECADEIRELTEVER